MSGNTDSRPTKVPKRVSEVYITKMASSQRAKLATKILVGAGVLCLASGAASASTTQASSPISSEIQSLQATWGPNVVRSAEVMPGSRVILVGTRNQSLLRSAAPKTWLGTKYQVVVTFVRPPGSSHTMIGDQCASTTDVPMMEDFRDSN